MPKICFVEHDGTQHIVEAAVGENIKQVALDHMVPGIIGDCGGFATCGTCHAYIEPKVAKSLPAPDDNEQMILEGVLGPLEPNSRLTCQVVLTADIAELEVHLPETQ